MRMMTCPYNDDGEPRGSRFYDANSGRLMTIAEHGPMAGLIVARSDSGRWEPVRPATDHDRATVLGAGCIAVAALPDLHRRMAAPDKQDAAVAWAQEVARSEGPAPWTWHRHYKGGLYLTVGPAVIEDGCVPATLYLGSKCRDVPWVRPLSDWSATVDCGAAGVVPRFRPEAPDFPTGGFGPTDLPWPAAAERTEDHPEGSVLSVIMGEDLVSASVGLARPGAAGRSALFYASQSPRVVAALRALAVAIKLDNVGGIPG
jgi:hypothetical protein